VVWDCGEATHRRRGIDWPGDHRSDGVSIQLNCCPTLFLILIHLLFFCDRYCGHGGGEAFYKPSHLTSLSQCAITLLMGCSSGKLRVTEDGGLKGTPLHFLKAGWWATSSSLFLFFPCPEPLLINFFFFFFLSLFFMIYYQPCTCGQSVACHRWRHRHVYPNFA